MSGAIQPNPQSLVEAIVRCIDGNAVPQGLALCQRLNRQFPDHSYGWYLASFLMKKARNLRDALRAIDRALQLEDAAKYRLHKAKCLFESGDAPAAAAIAALLHADATGDAR